MGEWEKAKIPNFLMARNCQSGLLIATIFLPPSMAWNRINEEEPVN